MASEDRSRSRKWWWLGAVAVVVLGFGLYWFQPWKAVLDQTTDEAAPTGTEMASGEFASLDKSTSGTAQIIEADDGSHVLRLAELDTSNGPDVRVYLSTAAVDAHRRAFDDDFIDLGALKGNVGDSNYTIPDDVDLARYTSAVIWCRRFISPFGAAPLL